MQKQSRQSPSANPEPAYSRLHQSGELEERGKALWAMMESCRLCPRECGTKRLKGKKGFCGASAKLEVASFHPHFGEERPLVGRGGSGTIFFTHCSLRCVFCINGEISQEGEGKERSIEELAGMMLDLQKMGCHNVNLVTPTHYLPHIVLALNLAAGRGLKLPVVYNTSGWEKPDILKMLDGIVDIYLPDFKYWDGEEAARYSCGAETYPEITKAALLEMHRQVGVANPGQDGIMRRGLMIRHLVMPNRTSGTKEVLRWISENLSRDTYINIMSQYRPAYKANLYPTIARPIQREEYDEALNWAREAGLTNVDSQGW
ncbi:MAG TPA: radical SAM protein [bacterium]